MMTIEVTGDVGYMDKAVTMLKELHKFNARFNPAFSLSRNSSNKVTAVLQNKFMHAISDKECWVLAYENNIYKGLGVAVIHNNLFTRYVEIEALYVPENFRNSGVGKFLVKDLMQWALSQEIDDIRLFVSEKNSNALKFYENLGFFGLQRVLKFNEKGKK